MTEEPIDDDWTDEESDFLDTLDLPPLILELYQLRGIFMDLYSYLEKELHRVIMEWYEVPGLKRLQFEANMLTSSSMDIKINTMLRSIVKQHGKEFFEDLPNDLHSLNKWRNVLAHGAFGGQVSSSVDAVSLLKRNQKTDSRPVSSKVLKRQITIATNLAAALRYLAEQLESQRLERITSGTSDPAP